MPPASRITDMHTCPQVTVIVPHVGGPALGPPTPTVLMGGLPSIGMGAMCVCVGPPDSVAMGAMTVLVGSKPAARMGDSTAHGGALVFGFPTIIIGG